MTSTSIKNIGKEADAPVEYLSNVPESPCLQNDVLHRREFPSGARLHASSATSARLLTRRPPPLLLPPSPKRHLSYHANGQHFDHESSQDSNNGGHQAGDSNNISPGNKYMKWGRKRVFTPESDFEEDPDSCHLKFRSSIDDDADDGQVSIAATGNSKTSRADSLRCLCLRPKKIPRPRNVFMLYRQQTHADIVLQHPGIANPSISKIIGQKWRSMSDEEKLPWKELAEEEKKLHREMYPNYRYQPKRAGKANKGQPVSPGVKGDEILGNANGSGRCEKCGRHYVAPLHRTRLSPNSTRTYGSQPTASGAARDMADLRYFEFGNSRSRAQFASREDALQRQFASGQWPNSQDVRGRRFLSQGDFTDTRYSVSRSRPGFQALTMPLRGEERRSSDSPSLYTTDCIPNAAGDADKRHQSTFLHLQSLSPELPHVTSLPHFSATASARASPSSWMKLLPLPVCHPTRVHAAHATHMNEPNTLRSLQLDRSKNYRASACRLPKPLFGAQDCGPSTPLTATEVLFMHPTPAPTPVAQAFVKAMNMREGSTMSYEQFLKQTHPPVTPEDINESLELPPLMT